MSNPTTAEALQETILQEHKARAWDIAVGIMRQTGSAEATMQAVKGQAGSIAHLQNRLSSFVATDPRRVQKQRHARRLNAIDLENTVGMNS